jgi:PPOX class probable F420-dependent enzyme
MTRPSATVDEPTRHFLDRQRVAHLATADAGANPQVVPVCFALVAQTIYIAIDEKPKVNDLRRLKRLRNIAENARVALVADHYDDDDWTRLGFVMLRARARVLEPGDAAHTDAIAALRKKYRQYREMSLEQRPVIAADITTVTTWGNLDF